MDVDRQLINTAERVLRNGFPQSSGSACAGYSNQGRLVTASDHGQAELAVISACRDRGELIASMLTLTWNGAGSPIRVRAPTFAVLEQLQSQARRHAQIAVAGTLSAIVVRPLWELVLELDPAQQTNTARSKGHFGMGMKTIAPSLSELARNPGIARVHSDFPDLLRGALRHQQTRANAEASAPTGSVLVGPAQRQ